MIAAAEIVAKRAATAQEYAAALQQWKRLPAFSGLPRHLIEDVHGGFRRIFTQSKKAATVALAAGQQVDTEKAKGVFRQFKANVAQLVHHHRVEDEHFFPMFRQQHPTAAPAFDVLEQDHQQLHPLEAIVENASAPLADRLGAVVEFVDFLFDHLMREEMLIVSLTLGQ
jgi:iron-sulfur cluster repair protein YtfE (RIC family)